MQKHNLLHFRRQTRAHVQSTVHMESEAELLLMSPAQLLFKWWVCPERPATTPQLCVVCQDDSSWCSSPPLPIPRSQKLAQVHHRHALCLIFLLHNIGALFLQDFYVCLSLNKMSSNVDRLKCAGQEQHTDYNQALWHHIIVWNRIGQKTNVIISKD